MIRRLLPWLGAFILLSFGLAARLSDLSDLPLEFHPTRQLHSAVIARGLYYADLTGVPEWQRQRAVAYGRLEGLVEPQIVETLSAWGYRLAGSEQLWIPRALSIAFWCLGGLALFLFARRHFSPAAALFALGFFLVLPYGILASRVFMPDPLMTALLIWALYGLDVCLEEPSWPRLIAAGLLGGLAVFIKSTAVFFIGPLFLAGVIWRYGRGFWRVGKVWALAALVLMPFAAYWIWGVWINGILAGQTAMRFFPQYWLDPVFYLRWWNILQSVFSLPWLLLAGLGLLLLPRGPARWLISAGFAGEVLMGFALSHHTATHDYYQLPLIPFAALALAGLAQVIFDRLAGERLIWRILAALMLFSAAGLSAYQARAELRRTDYRPEAAFWQNLGQQIGLDKSVVALSEDYGYRLEYWGWIRPVNWLSSGDFAVRRDSGQTLDAAALIRAETEGRDYFLVTLLEDLDRQPEVKEYLLAHYPLVIQTRRVWLFDLRGGQP